MQAPSSCMTVRQLLQWLTLTLHLPGKILQYERFSPLYNDSEAPNESTMEMVQFVCVCECVCSRLLSTPPCRNLLMQLLRKQAVLLSTTVPTLISASRFKRVSRTTRCLACEWFLISFECGSFRSFLICARLIKRDALGGQHKLQRFQHVFTHLLRRVC